MQHAKGWLHGINPAVLLALPIVTLLMKQACMYDGAVKADRR